MTFTHTQRALAQRGYSEKDLAWDDNHSLAQRARHEAAWDIICPPVFNEENPIPDPTPSVTNWYPSNKA